MLHLHNTGSEIVQLVTAFSISLHVTMWHCSRLTLFICPQMLKSRYKWADRGVRIIKLHLRLISDIMSISPLTFYDMFRVKMLYLFRGSCPTLNILGIHSHLFVSLRGGADCVKCTWHDLPCPFEVFFSLSLSTRTFIPFSYYHNYCYSNNQLFQGYCNSNILYFGKI